MAIWSDISRRASAATSKTVQQMRTLSEISQLNSIISEKEKERDSIIYEIGKLYVQMNRENHEKAFEQYFTQISSIEIDLANHRDQILRIKGMFRCCNCGAEVNQAASFCSSCGTPVKKDSQENVVEESLRLCVNCGYTLENGMNFCENCGLPVEFENSDFIETEPMECRCEKCGALMDEGDTFCIECGAGL